MIAEMKKRQPIGILALQGSFLEHALAVEKTGAQAVLVRLPKDLEGVKGLIIPGGESTTISKLLDAYNLTDIIRNLALRGFPLYGTCAGMILLSKKIENSNADLSRVNSLSLIDITIRRNAFGRQLESFEEELDMPVIGKRPFHAIFIRAPLILQVGSSVRILASLKDNSQHNLQGKQIVAVEQGAILVTAFHPELTDDLRIHRYFLEKVKKYARQKNDLIVNSFI